MWDLDSSNFHLSLVDKLRQSNASYNNKKLKLHYQAAMRMVTIKPRDLTGYRKYVEEEETKDVLPLSTVTEFRLLAVNVFGALYEASFQIGMVPNVAKYYNTFEILQEFTIFGDFSTSITIFLKLCNTYCNTFENFQYALQNLLQYFYGLPYCLQYFNMKQYSLCYFDSS